MLEINPNCGAFYPPTDPGSADLCLLQDPEGHGGWRRLLLRRRSWGSSEPSLGSDNFMQKDHKYLPK